jgi:hypothetical protein
VWACYLREHLVEAAAQEEEPHLPQAVGQREVPLQLVVQGLRAVDGRAREELLADARQLVDRAVEEEERRQHGVLLAVVLDGAHHLAPGLRLAGAGSALGCGRRLGAGAALGGRRLVGLPLLARRLVGRPLLARRLVGRPLLARRLVSGLSGSRLRELHAVVEEVLHREVREHIQDGDEPVGRPAAEALVLVLGVVDLDALGAEVPVHGVPFHEEERLLGDERHAQPILVQKVAGVPDAEAEARDLVLVHAGDARRLVLHESRLRSRRLCGIHEHRRPGFSTQARHTRIAAIHEFRGWRVQQAVLLLLLRRLAPIQDQIILWIVLEIIPAQARGQIIGLLRGLVVEEG